jgi:serine O-acetyltransferase
MDRENLEKIYELCVNEPYLLQDLERWAERLRLEGLSDFERFSRCFKTRQEFRSVIKYRIGRLGTTHITQSFNSIMSRYISYAFVQNLFLSCKDIGPGLYIEHGFSSIVFAKEIGENFHLNQCVTVGSGKGGVPRIGNNVSIHCNSVVIGGIDIGNSVTVAAGSTVVDSVPASCIVASPKACIVKYKK